MSTQSGEVRHQYPDPGRGNPQTIGNPQYPDSRGGHDHPVAPEHPSVETIAAGSGIREIARLRKRHGQGRWRKRKGYAEVRLGDGTVARAELHWYEASGIGKREFKIKRFL